MSGVLVVSGLGRGTCSSTALLDSAVGETLVSGVILVRECALCALVASPKRVRCGLRGVFPTLSATVTRPAASDDRAVVSELSDMILPARLCVKSGDLTGDAVACCEPSPGVLRPPRGTPLPENSWMEEKAATVPLDGAGCERTTTTSPVVARLCGDRLCVPGRSEASKYWPASAPRTDESIWLMSFCWTCLPAASPCLFLVDRLSATGEWGRFKLFLVVSRSSVRLLLCAGERYWVPVLSKLYTWPLFSHWIRCLHGPTRARKWCWPVPKHTKTPSRQINTNTNFSMAQCGGVYVKRSNTETLTTNIWVRPGWWAGVLNTINSVTQLRTTSLCERLRLRLQHFVMWVTLRKKSVFTCTARNYTAYPI